MPLTFGQTQIGEPSEDYTKYDPLYRSVADYLGVDVNTDWTDQKNKLEYFIDWGKRQTKSSEPDKIILAISQLDKKFGNPSWDERRIGHLYKNLRLSEIKKMPKEISKKEVKPKEPPLTKMISRTLTQTIEKEIQSAQKQVQSQIQLAMKKALSSLNIWKDRKRIIKI